MLLVQTELRASPLHGVGCFTLEPISAGQLVWVQDKRIDLVFRLSELLDFPSATRDFIRSHGYRELLEGEEVIVLCGDNAKYMNHTTSPNLIEGSAMNTITNVAAFDIGTGEELTCNYYDFDLDAEIKLQLNQPIEKDSY
jgi:SET domain-containing protein